MRYVLLTIAVFFALNALASQLSGYQGVTITGVSAVIANGGTASSLINLNGFSLVGIKTPAALTGSAFTFSSCASDGNSCVPIKVTTSGTALSYTVTTSSYYSIDPSAFYGVQYLKINSGSAEGAARTLVCSLKGI